MNEKEFNLIDEPWIRVMENDCEIKEVSLMDAIVNAHRYKALGGEIPTQDIAVMRVILAVLHTVFSRYDENGEQSELNKDEYEAESRWKALWEKGCFPENAVREYLEEWHERFWLFHPQRPFFQVTEQEINKIITTQKDMKVSKLNGEVSESNNKVNFFSSFAGNEKETLSYSQAARWLIFLNSFDDTSFKPQGENLPSAKIGWLGQLGIIYILGNNLFETLMLNMAVINDGKVEAEQFPIWENESIRVSEREEVAFPANLAELYTIQSRRIYLLRDSSGYVNGYRNVAGDILSWEDNIFEEPMTIWGTSKKIPQFPKKHDIFKQMWREFSVIYKKADGVQQAGVISWYKNYVLSLLKSSDILKTAILSAEYDGSSSHKLVNFGSDSLAMHSEILSELGEGWIDNIETEIKKCDDAAYAISLFAAELYLASGGKKEDKTYKQIQQDAKTKLYYNFDMPFRNWLYSIDPGKDDKQDKISEWHKSARQIAYRCMHEFADNASETALTGKRFDNKLYSLPKAINIFRGMINKIYKKEGDKNGK